MKLFKKVAIVGVGLIGGSLALDIKKRKLADEVIGVGRHKKNLLLAEQKGIIDKGQLDINAVKDADLVILCTPVGTIFNLAQRISRIIGPDCIVCDVGSTKEEIVSKLDKIFKNYVGCHPLAGSEKRGVSNSKEGIFKGSICILTPTARTSKDVLSKIEKLWETLGAKVINLPASEHDKIVSYISHLPHIVAFSLAGAPPRNSLRFASTGFKDTTRIAASDSEIWSDIFLSNQKNILKAIDSFQVNLSKIRSAIEEKDRKTLDSLLKKASDARKKINGTV